MTRTANAVDFWRGFALVTIFINHIPGNVYENFTHRRFSLSDSAELFVFLAGWALATSTAARQPAETTTALIWRLERRALMIYLAQVVMTAFAVAMLAGAAMVLATPDYLQWHNVGPVLNDAARANIGLVLMSHQMGYFNILPLYVVLMAAAPLIVLLYRKAPAALFALSFGIYLYALAFRVNIPTWPADDEWFLNPLTWQFLFVLGFLVGETNRVTQWMSRNMLMVRLIAAPVLFAGFLISWNGWWPGPPSPAWPELFFVSFKVYLTPIRLAQFLALVAVGSLLFPYILRGAKPVASALSLLGRNSLPVFMIGSLLSLAGQILRFQAPGLLAVDTALVSAGIAIMLITAFIAEWPKRQLRAAMVKLSRPASESTAAPIRQDGHSPGRFAALR